MIRSLNKSSLSIARGYHQGASPTDTKKFTFYQKSIFDHPLTLFFVTGVIICGTACITYSENKKLKIWKKILKDSDSIRGIHNRDCVIYFEALADHNRALTQTRPQILLANLATDHCITPIYKKVQWTHEITHTLTTLNKQKNRIHAIVIAAHGHPTHMVLSTLESKESHWESFKEMTCFYERTITPSSIQFQKTIKDLQHKPVVILASCSTASEKKGQPSLARLLSKNIPESPIIAATQDVAFAQFNFIVKKSPLSAIQISPEIYLRNWKGTNIATTFKNGKEVI